MLVMGNKWRDHFLNQKALLQLLSSLYMMLGEKMGLHIATRWQIASCNSQGI